MDKLNRVSGKQLGHFLNGGKEEINCAYGYSCFTYCGILPRKEEKRNGRYLKNHRRKTVEKCKLIYPV